jgi:hypothetical protein
MLYGGQLTLETVSRFGISDHGAHRVSLGDALKHETLEFLAQRCEDQAFALSETMPPTVDVRAACKV